MKEREENKTATTKSMMNGTGCPYHVTGKQNKKKQSHKTTRGENRGSKTEDLVTFAPSDERHVLVSSQSMMGGLFVFLSHLLDLGTGPGSRRTSKTDVVTNE